MLALGIDPSSRQTACALVEAPGRLVGVAMLRPDKSATGDLAAAQQVELFREWVASLSPRPDLAGVEDQWVHRGHTKQPKNILILAHVAGGVYAHTLGAGIPTKMVPPMDWKSGNVPKRVNQPRVLRKLGLTPVSVKANGGYAYPEELPHGTRRADWYELCDAAGIALWCLDAAAKHARKQARLAATTERPGAAS